MRIAALIAVVMWVCVGQAQIVVPGAEFRIDFDERWKDIHWDGAYRPPSKHAPGTPIASFQMTCVTVSLPPTWTITGYQWDGVETDIIEWESRTPECRRQHRLTTCFS